MSGIASFIQRALGDDLAILQTNGLQLSGWTSAAISRGIEAFPSWFRFSATESFPFDPSQATANPGDPCTVMLGADVVITGFVDSVEYQLEADRHELVISGRGKCCDLIDCSADLSAAGIVGAQINNTNALDLAQRLSKPFKIDVVNNSKQKLPPIDSVEVALGETPYEIIERACRFSTLILYENEKGQLVLDDLGTKSMGSGFQEGGNIEGAQVRFDFSERFSDYTVVWQSVDTYSQMGSSVNYRAQATDKGVPRYRPKIIVSEQYSPDFNYGQRRVNWEVARRYGRSQALTVRCDSWRDIGAMLWQLNYLAAVNVPSLKLTDRNWLIGSVTFTKDLGGTHAELLLMPPSAFSPQPNVLLPFDRQIGQDLNKPASPAPPGPGPN